MIKRYGSPLQGFLSLTALLILTGCASHEAPRPAQFWGGVGFSYEADKITDTKRYDSPEAATHISFEKELGSGFGIGAEVAGIAR